MAILRAGGNAVDAAIAATATQGVVAPETCGIGGDLFALVHRPGWAKPRALNATGRAGSGASPRPRRDRVGVIGRDDPRCVTVPGCVDGWAVLSADLGKLSLSKCLGPAIAHAEEGFEASSEQAAKFAREAVIYAGNPAVSDLYPDGHPVRRGDRVTRRALAATLEAVADRGRDAFYLGVPAEDIVDELGGLITRDDLARHHADWVEPISCQVAGLSAWTLPPNSQGYLGPAALAIFELLEPPGDSDDPDWWHLLIESFRAVAWERDDLVSDPDHAPLPPDLLLERGRLQRAADSVDRARAGVWPRTGSLSSTAYMCVVDSDGMAVSIIQSNFEGPGSHFGARRSGFLLHNRGSGFTTMPGHPNEIRPGKRPRHTLSPTLWADDSGPTWVLGTRGGSLQPQLVAQVAARVILGGADIARGQEAPRWTVPDFGPMSQSRVLVEPGVPPATLEALRHRGHVVEETPSRNPEWGPVSMIGLTPTGAVTAGDPRVDTTSAVVI